jgi:phosphatidylserine synthase
MGIYPVPNDAAKTKANFVIGMGICLAACFMAVLVLKSEQFGIKHDWRYGWELYFFVPIAIISCLAAASWELWNFREVGRITIMGSLFFAAMSFTKQTIYFVAAPVMGMIVVAVYYMLMEALMNGIFGRRGR